MTEQITEITNVDERLAQGLGYKAEEIAVIKKTVAKGANNTELAFFLNVCKSVELNPFNKEIWCYKDNKNNLIIFAGRDGLLAKAQKNPLFGGIRSAEVRLNDEFEMDIFNNHIVHKVTKKSNKERGAIIGAYAVVFRKGGECTIEWVDFSEYNKGYNTWKTHGTEMIKKVAESHALKKAFGLSGVQLEEDWSVSNKGIAEPVKQKDHSELEEMTEEAEVVDVTTSTPDPETLTRCDACGDELKGDEVGICADCVKELHQ